MARFEAVHHRLNAMSSELSLGFGFLKPTSISQSSFGKKKEQWTNEPLCKILPVLSDGTKLRSLLSHLILRATVMIRFYRKRTLRPRGLEA